MMIVMDKWIDELVNRNNIVAITGLDQMPSVPLLILWSTTIALSDKLPVTGPWDDKECTFKWSLSEIELVSEGRFELSSKYPVTSPFNSPPPSSMRPELTSVEE